ncbi:MAG: glycosyltransferase [Candidatus Thermoplasmatota archaeon]|nr:glycosyltransferase [Candidatus Thermoplasmatota archaeon]
MSQESLGISIVITVKNEASNLGDLFLSLKSQEQPFEVVLVDSDSTDNTGEVVNSFRDSLDINHIVRRCSRGEGRNIGVKAGKYDFIVFVDGDVVIAENFLHNYRKKFESGFEFIAGEVVSSGIEKFILERVKLFFNGFEITRPSANLGYSRARFLEIGGFDEDMVTAEDIDMNLRALRSGLKAAICTDCIVHNKTRDTYSKFVKQAFWNGYGRKQLKTRNAPIWKEIQKGPKLENNPILPNFIRLASGGFGYCYAILKSGKYPT